MEPLPAPEARELMDAVEKEAGMKLITVGIYEERSFFNNKKPIRRIEDVKGMRIRTMGIAGRTILVSPHRSPAGPFQFPGTLQHA